MCGVGCASQFVYNIPARLYLLREVRSVMAGVWEDGRSHGTQAGSMHHLRFYCFFLGVLPEVFSFIRVELYLLVLLTKKHIHLKKIIICLAVFSPCFRSYFYL
jgi:hypothetical protein